MSDLNEAVRKFAEMKHPSVEKLLRGYGYGVEADICRDLVEAYETQPELVGPCNFQFDDVDMQAERLELAERGITLTDEQKQRAWDESVGQLKHCDSVSYGNDVIAEAIESALKEDGIEVDFSC
jgi:hypothetical protein